MNLSTPGPIECVEFQASLLRLAAGAQSTPSVTPQEWPQAAELEKLSGSIVTHERPPVGAAPRWYA